MMRPELESCSRLNRDLDEILKRIMDAFRQLLIAKDAARRLCWRRRFLRLCRRYQNGVQQYIQDP